MSNAREKKPEVDRLPLKTGQQTTAAQALAVVCPYCHAPIGIRCRRPDGQPVVHFPAHTKRIAYARNPDAGFSPEPSGPYIPREDTR